MADFRQESIPGGHLVIMDAEVADGHLQVITTWEHVIGEELEVAGSTCTLRTAYINGHVVLDPDYAQQLWAEACKR